MGQGDILKALKKNGGWMTTNELEKATGSNNSSLNRCLSKLRRTGEVLYKSIYGNRSDKYISGPMCYMIK